MPNTDLNVVEKVASKNKNEKKFPPMFKVILLNDDYTPMVFVQIVLNKIFNKSEQESELLALKIHEEGRAVVGVYSKEVAETKKEITLINARKAEHPLKCIIELAEPDNSNNNNSRPKI